MKRTMDHQLPLFRNQQPETGNQGPVECLGKTFHNDDDRRKYFLEKLREKQKDSEFRKIEGFPMGSDEDILALSNPPYYTVCQVLFFGNVLMQKGRSANCRKKKARI
jgi:hypothetical protein